MNAVWPQLPALMVVIPLVAAALVALLRRGGPAFALTLIVSWILPFVAGAMLWQVLQTGPISYAMGGWEPPWGIEYRVDVLNAFVLVLVSVVGAVTMPFAWRSIAFEIAEERHAWFYCMYLLCLAGLLGIAITGDAFNAFVFLEVSSLATYVMIALGHDRRALLAAFQYLIMGTIGATFYVIGVGFLYLLTGSLNIADIASRLGSAESAQMPAIITALAFITVGISLKLALFPLHAWLPNAYAYAPSWVTAFLSGTATKVAIYLLMRYYFSVFGVAIDFDALPITETIIALSIAAMVVASLVAVFETDLKRMLAYSSVAQIGYITLGIGLANQAGLTGGLVHIVNHALMKAALFLAVGAVFYRACPVQLKELSGIGRKMPITMVAFTIAGFGLIGTPGTSGFISKWYLAVGALEKGWWLIVFAHRGEFARSRFSMSGGFLEIVWLREPSPAIAQASDPPLSMLLPIVALAAATIYFGLDTRVDRRHCERDRQSPDRRVAMTFSFLEGLALLAVVTPFIGALILPVFHKLPNLREAVTLVTAGTLCLIVFSMLGPVLGGARPETNLLQVAPGLELAFKVEPLGMLFALVASSLWIVNSIYSIGYMRANNEERQTGFYVCFAIALGSTIGLAFAKNLFTLFLFYEILTLSTYPLVTHKRNAEARARRANLSSAFARHVAHAVPAGHHRHLGAGRHARFHAGRHSRGQGRRTGDCRPARAVRVRNRQGRADADSFLAAGGDGRADAGQCAAARRGGGEGGRVHHPQGGGLYFRHRNVERFEPVDLADRCRWYHRDRRLVCRVAAGQLETPARLFDRFPTLLRRPWRRHSGADFGRWRGDAPRRTCGEQDYAIFCSRFDLHRRAPDRGESA